MGTHHEHFKRGHGCQGTHNIQIQILQFVTPSHNEQFVTPRHNENSKQVEEKLKTVVNALDEKTQMRIPSRPQLG